MSIDLEAWREKEEKERRHAIIFYITIGTILMLFSYYKTGMVLNAAGIFLYLISTMEKRAAKKDAEENPGIEIVFIDDHRIMIDGKIVNREEDPFLTAENPEKTTSTTNDTKEHENEDKNIVSE